MWFCAGAGFNFNDGAGGGDQVHGNLIFNSCRETSDHGGSATSPVHAPQGQHVTGGVGCGCRGSFASRSNAVIAIDGWWDVCFVARSEEVLGAHPALRPIWRQVRSTRGTGSRT